MSCSFSMIYVYNYSNINMLYIADSQVYETTGTARIKKRKSNMVGCTLPLQWYRKEEQGHVRMLIQTQPRHKQSNTPIRTETHDRNHFEPKWNPRSVHETDSPRTLNVAHYHTFIHYSLSCLLNSWRTSKWIGLFEKEKLLRWTALLFIFLMSYEGKREEETDC